MASKRERKKRQKSQQRRERESRFDPGKTSDAVDGVVGVSLAEPRESAPAARIKLILDAGGGRSLEAAARAARLAEAADRARKLAVGPAGDGPEPGPGGGAEPGEADFPISGRKEDELGRREGEDARRQPAPETPPDMPATGNEAEAAAIAPLPLPAAEIDRSWWDKPAAPAEPPANGGYGNEAEGAVADSSLPVTMTAAADSGDGQPEPPSDAGPAPEAPCDPRETKMFIVMVTPEVAPCAKVGGLGDVVLGLGKELMRRGHRVEVVCPMYSCMRYDEIHDLHEAYHELWCPHGREWRAEKVFQGTVAGGLKVNFITGGSYTERNTIYGHPDDMERFTYFSRQALEYMFKTNQRPDIIHCHDWATGLIPVALWDIYQKLGWNNSRVVYTIHNNECQGLCGFGDRLLGLIGLDAKAYHRPDRLQDDLHRNCINMMKGGIVYSNFVTTVSPSYAGELRSSVGGRGLEQVFSRHSGKLGGILNGIDYDAWNPETDPKLAGRYAAGDSFYEKFKNKKALREWLGLGDVWRPIVSAVTRLTHQKGLDLIKHGIFSTLRQQGQFVLLGSAPDKRVGDDFLRLQHELKDNHDVKLYLGYHEDLSHLIYAGSDLFLVPSLYEPCGLTQMISLRYGTVPVVRETGGLNDSVFDVDTSGRRPDQVNGFTFRDPTAASLDYALTRAIRLWYDNPPAFNRLAQNGMRHDYSWREPTGHYENIYNYVKA
ncbi:MAG: glycogen synthase GlgA [Planctomycetota bacterium]|jgi:starch synthase|nr:glycogen synthase GlgA [Planctomycetota bacterium]